MQFSSEVNTPTPLISVNNSVERSSLVFSTAMILLNGEKKKKQVDQTKRNIW